MEDVHAEIRQLLANGRKIEAIKLLRDHSDLGLKEAKEYVEAIEQGRTPPHVALQPRSSAERTVNGGPGCLFVVALIVAAIALWYLW